MSPKIKNKNKIIYKLKKISISVTHVDEGDYFWNGF